MQWIINGSGSLREPLLMQQAVLSGLSPSKPALHPRASQASQKEYDTTANQPKAP